MKWNKPNIHEELVGQFSDPNPKKPTDLPRPPKPNEEIHRKYTTEINGPNGLEPTRYGDWEKKGICYDF